MYTVARAWLSVFPMFMCFCYLKSVKRYSWCLFLYNNYCALNTPVHWDSAVYSTVQYLHSLCRMLVNTLQHFLMTRTTLTGRYKNLANQLINFRCKPQKSHLREMSCQRKPRGFMNMPGRVCQAIQAVNQQDQYRLVLCQHSIITSIKV